MGITARGSAAGILCLAVCASAPAVQARTVASRECPALARDRVDIPAGNSPRVQHTATTLYASSSEAPYLIRAARIPPTG